MQPSSSTDPSKLRRRDNQRLTNGQDMMITDHSVVMQDVADADEGNND